MTEGGRCSHCGSDLHGAYCARCGQPVRTGRLTVYGVLGEGLKEFFDLESGLLRTLRDLLLAPDRVIRGYWTGHTRAWVSPGKFYFLSLAVAQFVAWQSGALGEFAGGLVSADPEETRSVDAVVAFLGDYLVLLAAAGLALPVTLGAALSRRSLAEHVVFAFFAFGELAVLGAVLQAVAIPVPGFPATEIHFVLTPVYLWWAIRRAFRVGIVRAAVASLALVLGTVVGMAFILGVLSGTGLL